MVQQQQQQQLSTLQQLKDSGFGRPFPHHGLQLLFWFANRCLTCEPAGATPAVMLEPECQPENGSFGFHPFRNVEKILPMLKKSHRRQFLYYEVGNPNTGTHPGSADLPVYVRENYQLVSNHGDHNVDRLIIRYQVCSRAVEALFVTQHATLRGFEPAGTYEVTWDLVRVLRCPQLDLSSFLTQTGYYEDRWEDWGVRWLHHHDPERDSNLVSQFPATFQPSAVFPFMEAFGWPVDIAHQEARHLLATAGCDDRPVTDRSAAVAKHRKPKKGRLGAFHHQTTWSRAQHRAFHDAVEGGGDSGGGVGLIRLILAVGAIYVTAKCLSWCVRTWWKDAVGNGLLQMAPGGTEGYPRVHIMLDYVY